MKWNEHKYTAIKGGKYIYDYAITGDEYLSEDADRIYKRYIDKYKNKIIKRNHGNTNKSWTRTITGDTGQD